MSAAEETPVEKDVESDVDTEIENQEKPVLDDAGAVSAALKRLTGLRSTKASPAAKKEVPEPQEQRRSLRARASSE